mgnify:CR=1 FL=1
MNSMEESIKNAIEEMKRVDHLIFVSLKYTRTVDVFKNTLVRIIEGFDFGITALIESLVEKNKITNPPAQPIPRCNILREHFSDDETIMEMVDFYLFLRKLNKADKEILLWGFVHRYKHNETFFARERIENYDCQLRGRN